jgi:hypothetical protein
MLLLLSQTVILSIPNNWEEAKRLDRNVLGFSEYAAFQRERKDGVIGHEEVRRHSGEIVGGKILNDRDEVGPRAREGEGGTSSSGKIERRKTMHGGGYLTVGGRSKLKWRGTPLRVESCAA